jgi:hypothetical protein
MEDVLKETLSKVKTEELPQKQRNIPVDTDMSYMDIEDGGLYMAEVYQREISEIRDWETRRDENREKWAQKNKRGKSDKSRDGTEKNTKRMKE